MTQTVKGQQDPLQKRNRPGQRQRERLERIARRRKRRQITLSILASIVLLVLVGVGFWQYQRITDQQRSAAAAADARTTATASTRATTTANAAATASANVTATAGANGILTATSGSPIPSVGPASPPPVTGKTVTLPDGLKYIDIKVGPGPTAKAGSTVSVEYTGWLASNGKKFDSSYDHGGQVFPVSNLGQAQVIPGWNEGLMGMNAGGTRRLIIPAALAYGAQGSPPTIPPNAVLIFDVTAVTVQ